MFSGQRHDKLFEFCGGEGGVDALDPRVSW